MKEGTWVSAHAQFYERESARSMYLSSSLALTFGLIAGLVGLLYLFIWPRKNHKFRLPPERSGWVPWLGCAMDFGRAPLLYLQKTKKSVSRVLLCVYLGVQFSFFLQLGDKNIFTIHAMGRRMTFLTCHEDFKNFFFSNNNADFQAAVQPFTMKAGE